MPFLEEFEEGLTGKSREGKAIMNLRFNSKLVALLRFHIMLLGHGVSFLKWLEGLTLIFSKTESIPEVLKQF